MAKKQLEILVNARDNASQAFKSAGASAREMHKSMAGGDGIASMLAGVFKAEVGLKAAYGSLQLFKGIAAGMRGDLREATTGYLDFVGAMEQLPLAGTAFRMLFDVTGIRESLQAQRDMLREQAEFTKQHTQNMLKHAVAMAQAKRELSVVGLEGTSLERKNVVNDTNKKLEDIGNRYRAAEDQYAKSLKSITMNMLVVDGEGVAKLKAEARRVFNEAAKALYDEASIAAEERDRRLALIGNKRTAAVDALDTSLRVGGRSEARGQRARDLFDTQMAEELEALGNKLEAARLRLAVATRAQVAAIEKAREADVEKLKADAKAFSYEPWRVKMAEEQIREGARKEIETIQEVQRRKLRALDEAAKKEAGETHKRHQITLRDIREFQRDQMRAMDLENAPTKAIKSRIQREIDAAGIARQYESQLTQLAAIINDPRSDAGQRDSATAMQRQIISLRNARMEDILSRTDKDKEKREDGLQISESRFLTGVREAGREGGLVARQLAATVSMDTSLRTMLSTVAKIAQVLDRLNLPTTLRPANLAARV